MEHKKTLLQKIGRGLKNYFKGESFDRVKPSLMAITFGLLFGLVIMMIFNIREAFPAFGMLLAGPFVDGFEGLSNMLYIAAPIILTGLSVGFAFKTGLFNIGAPGQLIIGAYVAVHIGVLWTIPAPFHWMVALLFGMLAGALWGVIPGLLKALANVNEVVATIMLNYIGTYLVMFLVERFIRFGDTARSLDVQVTAVLPNLGIDKLLIDSQFNIGFFVALLAVIVIYIILNKTTLGYELRAAGFNKHASQYAGINTKRNIVISMAIAGALAGLAGAVLYLELGHNLKTDFVLSPEGFTGISVALLGLSEPFGALAAALFLSYISQGGFNMQLFDFKNQIIDVIMASIIYFSALSVAFQLFYKQYKVKRAERKKHKETSSKEVK
jgi:general nucleoside transport system permease protein